MSTSKDYPVVSESDSLRSQEGRGEEQGEVQEGEVFYPAEESTEETPRRSTRKRESINYNYTARRTSKKRNTSPLEELRAKSQRMSPTKPPGGHLLERTPQGQKTQSRTNQSTSGENAENGQDSPTEEPIPQIGGAGTNAAGTMQAGASAQGGDLLANIQGMFGNMTAKLDSFNEGLSKEIKSVSTTLDRVALRLDGRINSVADELASFQTRMEDRTADLESRLSNLEQGGASSSREEKLYWESRKSLRLSPIAGPCLLESLREFLVRRLDLDPSIMDRLSKKSIRKLPTRQGGRFSQEAIVKFDSIADRDMVKGSSYKLAGSNDASIRLELPTHLLSQHRVLSSAGQRLRSAYKGCRTNLRFEDETQELVLDYKLQDKQWSRLRHEEARKLNPQTVASVQDTSSEDFARLLDQAPRSAPSGAKATGANAQPIGE